jgi:CBS domain-containing protein
MLFPIKQLLEDKKPPICVSKDTLVRDALTLMVENEYSQLPIVDSHGRLTGIITEQSIIKTYFFSGGEIPLLEFPVVDCQATAVRLDPESDIFEALDRLEKVYAVVIVEEDKPIGILTDYDSTQFFRDLTEGLILVEDIEVSIRQIIDAVFENENDLNQALINQFGSHSNDPNIPRKTLDEISFGNSMFFITNDRNWDKFEPVFGNKELFKQLMDQVRNIRNQLAHFRGRLEIIQHNALLRARDWLAARPKPDLQSAEQDQIVHVEPIDLPKSTVEGKYGPLEDYLISQRLKRDRLTIAFEDLERIIDGELPPSSKTHRSWWSNHYVSHIQARSWLKAGWLVDGVDYALETVTFRQSRSAFYQPIFYDLLLRLKTSRPGVTQAKKVQLQNWFSFSGGVSGLMFGWVIPKEDVLRVELYIDTGEKGRNNEIFDKLYEIRDEVETEIGLTLDWDRLNDAQASRIYAKQPFSVEDTEQRDGVLRWGLETMLKFIDTFQPRIKNL